MIQLSSNFLIIGLFGESDMSEIIFNKANLSHQDIILSWLEESHIKEFWDSSQAHKDDIINFIAGRKTPSDYCGGHYIYWIASIDHIPFAMIMAIKEYKTGEINQIKIDNLSKIGHTYSIDFMIGNIDYLGRGLGARTISEFLDFIRSKIDPKATRFLIDPASDNPRAKHVYEKAGFEYIGYFIMEGAVSGKGKPHHLLMKSYNNC